MKKILIVLFTQMFVCALYAQTADDFRIKANNGDAYAQYALGWCYQNGKGVSQDYSQAVYWYKKSAEQGHIDACNSLGQYYYDDKNFSEAFHWFYKSMEYGDGWATYRVGSMYSDGEGVTKDISKYIECTRKAYDLGYHRVATILLDIYTYGSASGYADGLEIAQDFDKAKQLRDSLLLTEKSKEVKSDMNEPFFGLKKSTKTNNNTFALIISNTSCENYLYDNTFHHDIRCFDKVCKLPFGIPSKNIHRLDNPTLANLMAELDWLKNVMDAYDGDAKIVFYYSGPGGTDETTTESFILPKDCDATDPSSGFALSELYEILGSMSAKSVLVFIDSNFNGTDRNGNMIVSYRGVKIKTKPTVPTGNMVVFNASQGNETAWTNKKYGVFTYFVAKTLTESQEDITLGELSEKVIKEVKRSVIMEHGVSQTPIILASPEVGADWGKWSINQ